MNKPFKTATGSELTFEDSIRMATTMVTGGAMNRNTGFGNQEEMNRAIFATADQIRAKVSEQPKAIVDIVEELAKTAIGLPDAEVETQLKQLLDTKRITPEEGLRIRQRLVQLRAKTSR